MAVNDFLCRDTFVAYLDISGFKEMMKENLAIEAMRQFYQAGYDYRERYNEVDGFFVSDCGILFVRKDDISNEEKLNHILLAIKFINKRMLEKDFMLKTSIAYGEFEYIRKLELSGIEKNPVYGNAYVKAVLDSEKNPPKLEPGLCRLVKEGLPDELNRDNHVFEELKFLKQRKNDKKHLYYFWNLDNPDNIEEFEEKYNDAYKWKFKGMLEALKNTYNNL